MQLKQGTPKAEERTADQLFAIYKTLTNPNIPNVQKGLIIESRVPNSKLSDWENEQRRRRKTGVTPPESQPKQIARLTSERDEALQRVEQLETQNQILRARLQAAQTRIAHLEAQITNEEPEAVIFEQKRSTINWDSITVGLKDWKTPEWIDSLAESDSPHVTAVINQKARKQLFSRLDTPPLWGRLLDNLRVTTASGEQIIGRDAIHASLTPGLVTASKEGLWTKDHHEVSFLIANHFRMMLLVTKSSYNDDPHGLYTLEQQQRIIGEGQRLYQERYLSQKTPYFLDLLQLLVYTPPDDPTHKESAAYLFRHSGDKEVLNNWQRRTGQETVQAFVLSQLSATAT